MHGTPSVTTFLRGANLASLSIEEDAFAFAAIIVGAGNVILVARRFLTNRRATGDVGQIVGTKRAANCLTNLFFRAHDVARAFDFEKDVRWIETIDLCLTTSHFEAFSIRTVLILATRIIGATTSLIIARRIHIILLRCRIKHSVTFHRPTGQIPLGVEKESIAATTVVVNTGTGRFARRHRAWRGEAIGDGLTVGTLVGAALPTALIVDTIDVAITTGSAVLVRRIQAVGEITAETEFLTNSSRAILFPGTAVIVRGAFEIVRNGLRLFAIQFGIARRDQNEGKKDAKKDIHDAVVVCDSGGVANCDVRLKQQHTFVMHLRNIFKRAHDSEPEQNLFCRYVHGIPDDGQTTRNLTLLHSVTVHFAREPARLKMAASPTHLYSNHLVVQVLKDSSGQYKVLLHVIL